MPPTTEKTVAAPSISSIDQQDSAKLYETLRKQEARIISAAGDAQTLPLSLNDFLIELAARLNDGCSVSIVKSEAKLTTVEAATILGTSRQFLVNLLEQGAIPYHKVGSHRRIYTRDLFQYKAMRDSSRRAALRDLVRAEVEEGLYAREPASAR